jgi:hypothetical protein
MSPPRCSRCTAPAALAVALGTERCALCAARLDPADLAGAGTDLGDLRWLVDKRVGKTRGEWVLLFPTSLPALAALVLVGVWVAGALTSGFDWAMDNWSALSFALVFALIWVAVGAFLIRHWKGRDQRVTRWVDSGIPGVGTVQAVLRTSLRASDGPTRLRGRWLTLSVELAGAAPFGTRSRVYLGRDEWERLRPGARVRLLADPADVREVIVLQILSP